MTMRTRAARRGHDAFPVRTVARMTGLSADLIRAWERRYGVVAPLRGPRGSRLYTAAEVTHLRLLARAVGGGRAIGDVARLDRRALEGLVAPPASAGINDAAGALLARAMEALERFDARALDRQLADALLGLGASRFVREILVPLLVEVGVRQRDGRLSIADEHLFSARIRHLLSGLSHGRSSTDGPVVVLATPSGERHEFGLLVAASLMVDGGLTVVHLGTDLPAGEIVRAARRAQAAAVGLGYVNSQNRDLAVEETRTVERGLPPHVELWAGGHDAAPTVAALGRSRAVVLDDLDLLEDEVTRLRAARAPR